MNTLSFLIDPNEVDAVKLTLKEKGATNYTVYASNITTRITLHEVSARQAADFASTLERNGIQIDVL